MAARTHTIVIQIETESFERGGWAKPDEIISAVMHSLPLGKRIRGVKIKGATRLADGVRKGYISGAGA